MKFTPTISLYLAKVYILSFTAILGILLGVVYLFETLELVRRAAKVGHVGLSIILGMGLYKTPELSQTILPFAVLFSAMFTFWLLTRRHELVVVRASGFSVWQFLAPVMIVAALLGVFGFAVLNPVSAVMVAKYESLESTYILQQKNVVSLFDAGLWLRQMRPDNQGYIILHADRIVLPQWELKGVTALFMDADDALQKRIDSDSALLQPGQWTFNGAQVHEARLPVERQASIVVPTDITTDEIEESFSSTRSQSFWHLPGYIRVMTETGFDATKLKIHFNSLLAQPVLFLAMVLLAATVALRPPRFQKSFGLIATGVMIGFLVFFLSSFLQALGASQQIPVLLAAWAPAMVTLLLGLAVILNLEDG